MKYCWTTIHVKNMEESLKFYQEIVGLTIDRRFTSGPERDIVFLGDGETKIELIYNEGQTDIQVGHDISMGFLTESVDEMMDIIQKKGLEPVTGVLQPNPHVKFFYVLDPNGVKIQFVENC